MCAAFRATMLPGTAMGSEPEPEPEPKAVSELPEAAEEEIQHLTWLMHTGDTDAILSLFAKTAAEKHRLAEERYELSKRVAVLEDADDSRRQKQLREVAAAKPKAKPESSVSAPGRPAIAMSPFELELNPTLSVDDMAASPGGGVSSGGSSILERGARSVRSVRDGITGWLQADLKQRTRRQRVAEITEEFELQRAKDEETASWFVLISVVTSALTSWLITEEPTVETY
eukprot:COSAG06_NODE_8117_length_2269_cov_1.963594_3_plen_229_part_00